jgi:hypothetical protein
VDIEIDVLRDWIDNRLADLARSKASRLQERQREFVDGSIDTLLGLRSQFCTSEANRAAVREDATRSKPRAGRSRKVDASQAPQAVC